MKRKLIASLSVFVTSVAFIDVSGYAATPTAGIPTLDPLPGKATCSIVNITNHVGKSAELCVTTGSFAHDLYEVRIDRSTVVKGIDDATTTGIASEYNGQSISLQCSPVLSAPDNITDAQIESVRFMNPSAKRDQLKQLFISINTTETGRRCTVRADLTELFSVDVHFR
ncbi:hypothetical protein [Paraburkholderia elongata]|uniref:Uncharacterized protein n=1 Tax=Paraburkholderia elongata TaxID=2675747 RepID=A0A972SQA6_9BURK|nr:hypothetical protein [Paraburkholderia elongata]NPT61915.1 hypothetical protein [Paraburkholderia elongata]